MKKTAYKWGAAFVLILGGGVGYYFYNTSCDAYEKRAPHKAESQSTAQTESQITPTVWSADPAANQPQIKSVAVSPDGKYTLIETRLPFSPEEGPRSQLTLVENKGSRTVWKTTATEYFFSPQWSPLSNQIMFLKSEKQPQIQTSLWITSVDALKPIKFWETESNLKGYKWSPNGEKVVVIHADPQPKDESKPSFTLGDPPKSATFSILFLKNLSEKTITLNGHVFSDFTDINQVIAWSPDSESLAMSLFSLDEKATGLFNFKIGFEGATPLHSHGNPLYPAFSPDGTKIAFVADFSADKAFPFKVRKRRVYVKEKSKDSIVFSSTPTEDPIIIGWFPDGQNLLIQEGYNTLNHLYKLPMAGGTLEQVDAHNTEELISHVSLNLKGTSIGFVKESLSTAPEAYISQLDAFKPQSVLSGFSLTLPLKSELIVWKSFDGTEIDGLLIYPYNYQQGNKYPLLVALHDGPYGAWTRNFIGNCSKDIPFSPAVFASKGYAVLLPNIRGSSNYGIEFAKAINKDIGGGDFKDFMMGIDYLISKGIADPDRLALWGWGYGGYLAAWATTQTNRFKAALVGAGITDLISFAGTTSEIGYLESYLGGYFWNNKPFWFSRSPIMSVQKTRTPTLLLYGDQDTAFPLSQGNELYYALKTRGVPVKMVTFGYEGHNFNFAPSLQEGLKLALDWFDLYLQPGKDEKSLLEKK